MVDGNKGFENLICWQESISLAVKIYKLTASFPSSEQFGITNQLRRASASVSANIAEGYGRQSTKEKVQFYYIAYGSLLETKSFLYLSEKLQYVSSIEKIIEEITLPQKRINALVSSIRNG